MGQYISLNGELVDAALAAVPVSDPGLLYGFGLFETVPVYNGVPFQLDYHIYRLLKGTDTLGIPNAPNAADLVDVVHRLIKKNGESNCALRIVLTQGVNGSPNLIADTNAERRYDPALYDTGMAVAISSVQRNATSPLAGMKTLNYLENILARNDARNVQCDEALLTSTEHFIAEGSCSNIFFCLGNELLTPSLDVGILPGVTRSVVLDIARDADLRVREEVFTIVDILDATEVFLTSSLMGIMPVRCIDGKGFGPRCPGDITTRVATAYARRVRTECGPAAPQ